jgi:hypothetical protein
MLCGAREKKVAQHKRRIIMAKELLIKQFIAGSCYSYILNSKNEALIIDPHISLEEEYTVKAYPEKYSAIADKEVAEKK